MTFKVGIVNKATCKKKKKKSYPPKKPGNLKHVQDSSAWWGQTAPVGTCDEEPTAPQVRRDGAGREARSKDRLERLGASRAAAAGFQAGGTHAGLLP